MSWYSPARRHSNDYRDGKRLVLPSPTTTSQPRLPTRRLARRWLGLIVYANLAFWLWRNAGYRNWLSSWFSASDEPDAEPDCVRDLALPDDPEGDYAAVSIYSFPNGTQGGTPPLMFSGHYVPYRHINHTPQIPSDPKFHSHMPKFEDPKFLSFACLHDYFTSGKPCPGPPPAHTFDPESPGPSDLYAWRKLDVVYAYVNSSDTLHHYHHRRFKDAPGRPEGRLTIVPPATAKDNVLREFDELRYSLRSVLENFRGSAGRVTVIGSEYPFPGCAVKDTQNSTEIDEAWTLGQLPQWLNSGIGRREWFPTWTDNGVDLRVVHHSSLFGDEYDPREPSFNSLAIESRLALLQGMSDDM